MSSVAESSMPEIFSKVNEWFDDMKMWPNVMYGDIYNYLISSKSVDGEEMKNFKSLQSYNYFQSGNVDRILHSTWENKLIMKASVRSSQTVQRLNEAYVICTRDGVVDQGWCTCMAGLGLSCSHVGALLWKLEHAVRNNLTDINCTDETAKWNMGTTRNVEPKPLVNIQFKKPKIGDEVLSEDIRNVPGVRDTPMYLTDGDLKASIRNSPLLPLFEVKDTTINKTFTCTPSTSMPRETVRQVHTEHETLTSCEKCTTFLEKFVTMSRTQIDLLQQETVTQSKCALWKDSRKLRITASNAHKVPVKETTEGTNFIREHLHPKFVGNKYTKHGQESEIIAKDYLISNGYNLTDTGMYVSFEENWLSASPDGILNGDTLLEIKSPVPTATWSTLDQLFSSGKYDVVKDNNDRVTIKEKGNRGFYQQIQLTMFCAGLRKSKLLVWLNANDHQFVDILYNENFVNSHVIRLKNFYAKKLMPCIVDEIEEDRLFLSRAFKKFMHF